MEGFFYNQNGTVSLSVGRLERKLRYLQLNFTEDEAGFFLGGESIM